MDRIQASNTSAEYIIDFYIEGAAGDLNGIHRHGSIAHARPGTPALLIAHQHRRPGY
jgi:hypothetical protein